MTINLQQFQENFLNYITEDEQTILPEVIGTAKADAQLRLQVYQNAYYLRLVDILAMDFPVLKQLVGEDKFAELGSSYVNAYPSNHFSIRLFGRHFSKFLASQSNLDPLLPEMAKFEWALSETQDAADALHITIEEMAQVPHEAWATMCFVLHPSLQVLPFAYNAAEIWKALNNQEPLPNFERYSDSMHWMFWRYDNQSYFTSLNQQQYTMLNAIREGKTFAEICEDLCECLEEEEVIQFAASTLRSWVGDGVFSSLHLTT